MVSMVYRALSADALQVMAGVMPIDLVAKKRKELFWQGRREIGNRNDINEAYQLYGKRDVILPRKVEMYTAVGQMSDRG